jgi:hypothetical protein
VVGVENLGAWEKVRGVVRLTHIPTDESIEYGSDVFQMNEYPHNHTTEGQCCFTRENAQEEVEQLTKRALKGRSSLQLPTFCQHFEALPTASPAIHFPSCEMYLDVDAWLRHSKVGGTLRGAGFIRLHKILAAIARSIRWSLVDLRSSKAAAHVSTPDIVRRTVRIIHLRLVAPHLAVYFKTMWFLAAGIALVPIVTYFYTLLVFRRRLKTGAGVPPSVPYHVPVVGHTVTFAVGGDTLADKLR